jgi:peptide deformylase
VSLLKIITIPDPVLKAAAQPVGKVDDEVRRQMDDMLETMYEAPGIGLAANQINKLNRVLVMDLAYRKEEGTKDPIFMANPEIVWKSEEMSVMEEGCLSIPGGYGEVERPKIVKVKYLDYNGNEALLEAEDLMSHCVQHEVDHLNGVLFIDYLSKLKRDMIVRKFKKAAKAEAET